MTLQLNGQSKIRGCGMILLVVTTILLLAAVILVIRGPKQVKLSELYTSSFFAICFAVIADVYLDLKLDLYGFFQKGPDWSYLPIFIIDYPAANILFLRFFPFEKSTSKKAVYILGWSLGTLALEQISLHTDLFYYNGWKWWYSAFAYPVIYYLLFLNLKLIRRLDSI
jgi:hypothetical protein